MSDERVDTPTFFTRENFAAFLTHFQGQTYDKPHDVLSGFIQDNMCCDVPTFTKKAGKLYAHFEGAVFEVPAEFDAIASGTPHTFEAALKRLKGVVKARVKATPAREPELTE